MALLLRISVNLWILFYASRFTLYVWDPYQSTIDRHDGAADPFPYLLHAGQTQSYLDRQSASGDGLPLMISLMLSACLRRGTVCLLLRKSPSNDALWHHEGLAQFRDFGISESASIFQFVTEGLLGDAQAVGDIVFAESACVDEHFK